MKSIRESSLLQSLSSIKRYNARNVADLTFLFLITLHVLRSEWSSAPNAKLYASQTLAFGNWIDVKSSNTDLYQMLVILMSHKEYVTNLLQNHKASDALIHDIDLDPSDIKRFLRNIASSTYDFNLASRMLYQLERDLRITTTNYKSVRRICSDWNTSHIDDEAKMLAITRLLQALKAKAPNGDLTRQLDALAHHEKLILANACNPETGKNCQVDTQHSKLGLLKQLALGAGLGIGAYYVGRALAGGIK